MRIHRRSRFVTLSILLVLPILAASAAVAAEHLVSLDPDATEIAFDLKATGHDVHGLFALDHGEIGFDPQSHRAWGDLAVEVRGAETGSGKRDKTMHRKVLESEEHPLVLFRAERIEGDIALEGESDFSVVGTVTLLGVEHPLSLPTHANIQDGHVEATIAFPVPFVDWGLHDPSMLFLKVAKIVDVTVTTSGTLSTPDPVATGGGAQP